MSGSSADPRMMRARPVTVALDPAIRPLDVLHRFADWPRPALLLGASGDGDLGRHSYFSADPIDVIETSADGWPNARARMRRTFRPDAVRGLGAPFGGGWIGWFAYELGRAFDQMHCATRDPMPVPDVALGLYDWVVVWDHAAGTAVLVSTGVDPDGECDPVRARARADSVLNCLANDQPTVPARSVDHRVEPFRVEPDFSPAGFQDAVARVIDHVVRGDIFQANLAQRFVAPFRADARRLFTALVSRTSASMAAYLEHGHLRILSASPERFLRYDPLTRSIETRPIKGTRPRGATPDDDAEHAAALVSSEKDRAENVMIVDLLRNDLARIAEPGSVEVPALCRLETYPAVHHLVSVVTATLREGSDALDLFEATFPGGSVTGAPKLRAMQVIAELEPVRRGAYCGAIGWIGLDGAMDTNVAIRTITLDGTLASLHAGGGITARSDPADEYWETLDKARALLAALEEVD